MVIFLVCASIPLYSQLMGYVFDEDNNEPLTGAEIKISSNNYAITDSLGYFKILVNNYPARLLVYHLGYRTCTVNITDSGDILRIGMKASSERIDDIIVTSAGFTQRVNAVAGPLSVITRDDIENDEKTNLSSVLNKQPGIFMQSGSLNTNRLLIRGIGSRSPYSSNRVKAYFEEIPLTTGEGVTTIEDLDPGSLGRIEIIRGPASGIYGSGLGGVINIFTDKPLTGKWSLMGTHTTGSFGLQKSSVQFGANSRNLLVFGGISFLISEGYRSNNEINRHSFHIYSRYFIKNFYVNFFIYHLNVLAYIPSSLNRESFDINPKMADPGWQQVRGHEKYYKVHTGITLTKKIGKILINHTTLFSSLFDQYESRPFNILDDNSVSYGIRTKFMLTGNGYDISSGTEIYRELYHWNIFETNKGSQGNKLSDNNEKRNYVNIFFHLKKEYIPNGFIITGLNINILNYEMTELPIDSNAAVMLGHRFNPVISPRFGINYKFHRSVSVFISLNHGFSAPSVEETLNSGGQINPDLKPESGWSLEAGIRGEFNGSRLFVELSLYKMYIKNLFITKRIGEDLFFGTNAGKTEHQGIEFSGRYNIWQTLRPGPKNLRVWFTSTFSFNEFKQFEDDETDYSGKHLPGIPSSVINAGLDLNAERGFNSEICFQNVAGMYLDDGNTLKTDNYHIVNVTFSYKSGFGKNLKLEGFLMAMNVLNMHYASMILVNAQSINNNPPRYYYPGLPVHFRLGIKVKFNK